MHASSTSVVAPGKVKPVKADCTLTASEQRSADTLSALFTLIQECRPAELHAMPAHVALRVASVLSSAVAWWKWGCDVHHSTPPNHTTAGSAAATSTTTPTPGVASTGVTAAISAHTDTPAGPLSSDGPRSNGHGPSLGWRIRLYSHLQASLLPHFPFGTSDLSVGGGAPTSSTGPSGAGSSSSTIAALLHGGTPALNLGVCDALLLCLPSRPLPGALDAVKAPGGLRLSFDWIAAVVQYLIDLFGAVGSSPGMLLLLWPTSVDMHCVGSMIRKSHIAPFWSMIVLPWSLLGCGADGCNGITIITLLLTGLTHTDGSLLGRALAVMQQLFPFVEPSRQGALFDAFSVVYSRSHKSSAIKRRCIAFMMAVRLLWGSAGSVVCRPCGIHVHIIFHISPVPIYYTHTSPHSYQLFTRDCT
jgi:hypothetical protein